MPDIAFVRESGLISLSVSGNQGVTSAIGTGVATNNAIVMVVYLTGGGSGITVTSVTDNIGNTYQLSNSVYLASTTSTFALAVLTGITGNPTTWTIQFTGSSGAVTGVTRFTEYANAAAINSIPGLTWDSSSTDTNLSTAISTTIDRCMVCGVVVYGTGFTSVGSGFTLAYNSGGTGHAQEYEIQALAGAGAITWVVAAASGGNVFGGAILQPATTPLTQDYPINVESFGKLIIEDLPIQLESTSLIQYDKLLIVENLATIPRSDIPFVDELLLTQRRDAPAGVELTTRQIVDRALNAELLGPVAVIANAALSIELLSLVNPAQTVAVELLGTLASSYPVTAEFLHGVQANANFNLNTLGILVVTLNDSVIQIELSAAPKVFTVTFVGTLPPLIKNLVRIKPDVRVSPDMPFVWIKPGSQP